MTDATRFSLLFRKYVDGTAMPEEKLEFFAMADDNQWQDELARLIDAELTKTDSRVQLSQTEKEEILSNIYKREQTERDEQPIKLKVTGRGLIWKLASRRKVATSLIAAAAVAAITLGVWLYYTPRQSRLNVGNPGLAMNDIAPGKNIATLTLADGKVINLDTNKSSVVVADSVKAMTTLIASTPRGGTYQFTLPDGTRVWLNADSKISFPSQFSGNERKVMLHGEAYFVVVHNAKQPFRVESRGQVVEDIGTAFNIEAYPGEHPIKTTLVEGSASVSSPDQRIGTHLLKPNQQAILDNDQINVTEVDSEDAIAWKNDILLFKNEDLGTALRKVGRWYNVDVVYQGKVETKAMFTGRISRTRNLSSVIEMLEATRLARFKIEGRRLMVMQ